MNALLFLTTAVILAFGTLSGADEVGRGVPSAVGTPWPSGVQVGEGPDGRTDFRISGLYGDRAKWGNDGNSVARRASQGVFGAGDSLWVDLATETAWLRTRKTRDELPALVDWLARWNGFIPTWEELLARDRASPAADPGLYRLLGRQDLRFDTGGLGFLQFIQAGDGAPEVVFTEGWHSDGRLLTCRIRTSWVNGDEVGFTTTRTDSTGSGKSAEMPVAAQLRLPDGRTVRAGFNSTTAHCRGEMKQALRICDANGLSIWKTESDLYGQCGVWAFDGNGDSIDELLVVTLEHGAAHVFAFGRSGGSQHTDPGHGH